MAFNLMGILREALSIFSKNGRLMAAITFHALYFYANIYLFFIFFINLFIADLVSKSFSLPTASSGTSEFAALLIGFKHDFIGIIGLGWIFFLAQSFTSVFYGAATISASDIIYGGENISIKDVMSRINRSWKKPFKTWFYIVLYSGGFLLFVLAILLPLLLLFVDTPFAFYGICIASFIAAIVLYSYLAVDFVLALVVSVIEEKSGIEALQKAGELVKGRKLRGFALNILFIMLILIVNRGPMLISITMSTALQSPLLVVCLMYMFQMFWFMTYTVYYHQCKKGHGEEVTLQETLKYIQISNAPLVNENLP